MNQDPLDQLFVKPEQIETEQKQLLAKMVFPFAFLDAESGAIHFKPTIDELNAKQKVLVYLLARLALSTRKDRKYPASASPREVESATNLPGGTVRPKLSQLMDEKVIYKSGEGYAVSSVSLTRAHKELERVLPED